MDLSTKKHIPTPFFVTFIAFHCITILSGFDPNFVTLYQVPKLPILSNFDDVLEGRPKKQQKTNQKTTTMNTTTMRMENERIFQVSSEKFLISLLNCPPRPTTPPSWTMVSIPVSVNRPLPRLTIYYYINSRYQECI